MHNLFCWAADGAEEIIEIYDFSIDHILVLHCFCVGSRAPTTRSRG